MVTRSKVLMVAIILAGIGLRLLAATRGHNYDFESYLIVVKVMEQGGNVYAETTRYNYGPIWSYILWFLNIISGKNELIFRYLLALFLSLVDIGIFAILWKNFGKIVGLLFLFNPVSIIISGFHGQFDNLAILTAMYSSLLIGSKTDNMPVSKKVLGLFILSLSLVIKHIFFLYPAWLAVKQKCLVWKIITLASPFFLFILSFAPYWQTGETGIIENVFLYNSRNNELLYNLLLPEFLQAFLSSRTIWYIVLIVSALWFQKKDGLDHLLLYSCILIVISPAIANQYLAIVIPFLTTNFNPFAFMYTLMATLHLLADRDGLHLLPVAEAINHNREVYYLALMLLLCASLAWTLWSQFILRKQDTTRLITEIDEQ